MTETADDTRQRLIEAAGEIFSDKGFRSATVREICRAAKANLASVNYYFGDKEQLYLEAVRFAHCRGMSAEIAHALPPGISAEDKLRMFVRTMVANLLAEDRPAWHRRLMLRELAEPTEACAQLVEDFIRPVANVLDAILRELLPPTVSDQQRRMIGFSVVGQCLFYKVHQPVASALIGSVAFSAFTVEKLADHIASFTLAALGKGAPVASTPVQQTSGGEQ